MGREFTGQLSDHSGNTYDLEVFPLTEHFNRVGAIYAFLKVPSPNFIEFDVLYIGKANDLPRRLGEHQSSDGKWAEALKLGFNAIGAFQMVNEADRSAIEASLIKRYSPPLNSQHNTLAGLLSHGLGSPRQQNALGAAPMAPGADQRSDNAFVRNTSLGPESSTDAILRAMLGSGKTR
jgi:GIY-YIG catalytic domain